MLASILITNAYKTFTNSTLKRRPLMSKRFPQFLLQVFSQKKHKNASNIRQGKFIQSGLETTRLLCSTFVAFHNFTFLAVIFFSSSHLNRTRGFKKIQIPRPQAEPTRWKARIKRMMKKMKLEKYFTYNYFVSLFFFACSSLWIWEIVERAPRYFNNN